MTLQRSNLYIALFSVLLPSFAVSFVLLHSSIQKQPRLVSTKLHSVKRWFSKLKRRGGGKTAIITPEATKALLTSRRTINDFETTQVPEEIVLRAIEAAIHAPCHKMTEPWRFILLGQSTISKIAELNAAEIAKTDPIKGEKKKKRWEAIPGWCVVTSAKSDNDVKDRENYAATCCAIQNFMLSLSAEGVGTKWTTGPVTRTTEFANLCWFDPNKEALVGCIWYGYAAKKEPAPVPKRRKSVEDVTSRRP